jgi:hypothetical protein
MERMKCEEDPEKDPEAPQNQLCQNQAGDCSTSIPKARPPWRRLRCGHRFHEACLFTWLRKAKRCPICRTHIREVPAWRRSEAASSAMQAGLTSTVPNSTAAPQDTIVTASEASGSDRRESSHTL